MKIGFVCNSAYQLMVAAIVKEIFYQSDETVLFLDNYFFRKIVKGCNFEEQSFFDNIVVAPKKITGKYCNDTLDGLDLDILHFFNWGTDLSRMLYEIADTTVIVLDEGMGSYRIGDIWKSEILLEKISEVWLIAPELSVDTWENIRVKKIPLGDIYTKPDLYNSLIEKLNRLFNYEPNELPDVIYFDRYFLSENTLPKEYERKIIEKIVDIWRDRHIGIKIHPSEDLNLAKYRYLGINVEFLTNYCTPWELMLFQAKKEMTLISINSTPIVYSLLLAGELGIDISSICLINVVSNIVDEQELYIIPLINKYNEVYLEKPVLMINCISELERLGSDNNMPVTLCEGDKLFSYNELEIIFKEHCSKLGNFLDAINVVWKKDEDEGNVYEFYSLLDEKIDRTFILHENVNKLQLEISSYENCFLIKNLKIYINNRERTLVYERIDAFFPKERIEICNNATIRTINISFEIQYPLFKYDFQLLQ